MCEEEEDYRGLVDHFVKRCGENHLELNMVKTKEIVVGFRKKKTPPRLVRISGSDVEIVTSYSYPDIQLDDKLEWSTNTRSFT